MNRKMLQAFGLKFHPFRPDVPIEALHTTTVVSTFLRRVELGISDGGYVMITGEPGSGKSVALRLLKKRLEELTDVAVGIVEHPQSRVSDFYREVGELFGVALPAHNRFAGFKALRARWLDHISTTSTRPVLVLDEAQEVITSVFGELRMLASKDLDSRQLLCVVFAGDQRLPDRFRSPELQPLGSRIRRRLVLQPATADDLLACLNHLLDVAGNAALMTEELKVAVVDAAMGNYRILMNLCDELLAEAMERNLPKLDEKLYLEVFAPPPRKTVKRK